MQTAPSTVESRVQLRKEWQASEDYILQRSSCRWEKRWHGAGAEDIVGQATRGPASTAWASFAGSQASEALKFPFSADSDRSQLIPRYRATLHARHPFYPQLSLALQRDLQLYTTQPTVARILGDLAWSSGTPTLQTCSAPVAINCGTPRNSHDAAFSPRRGDQVNGPR
jgi:hypothetical protein